MTQIKDLLDRARRAAQQKTALEKLVDKARANADVAAILSDATGVTNPAAILKDTCNSLESYIEVIEKTVGATQIPWPPFGDDSPA